MHRQSVKITTLVIIFSILSVYLQLFGYYFFDNPLITLGLSILLSLLLSHFSLEASLSYEPGFLQVLFTVLPGFLFTLLIYFNYTGGLFEYHRYLPALMLFNWLTPLFYFSIRYLCDPGPRFVGYRSYFIRSSLLFIVFYVLILADKLFLRPLLPPCGQDIIGTSNFIPFWTTAAHIEACVYHRASLLPLFIYILKYVLLFVPFGFYLRLAGEKLGFLLRSLLLLFVPFVLEAVQLLLKLGRPDMDDFLFSLLGCIAGVLIYHIVNRVFQAATGEAFLKERESYSFLRKLH